jgi:hypothetical protein
MSLDVQVHNVKISLRSKNTKPSLKSPNPDIQPNNTALKKENFKLHKKIAQLEVKYFSAKNRIVALEEEIKIFVTV